MPRKQGLRNIEGFTAMNKVEGEYQRAPDSALPIAINRHGSRSPRHPNQKIKETTVFLATKKDHNFKKKNSKISRAKYFKKKIDEQNQKTDANLKKERLTKIWK
jgi:hypothetical protein